MIAIAALCFAAHTRSTLTFGEIELHMHEDYRRLQGFQEELTEVINGKSYAARTVRKIDGKRSFCAIYMNDALYSESFYDGKTYCMVNAYEQSFTRKDEANEEFEDTFQEDKPDPEAGFSWQPQGAYNMHFLLPNAHVTGVGTATLDGQKFRMVNVAGGPDESKDAAKGVMYFEPDAYILRRFEISVPQEDGTPYSFVVNSMIKHGVQFKPEEFVVDPKQIQGYVKKSG
jgi:hypothetical protein